MMLASEIPNTARQDVRCSQAVLNIDVHSSDTALECFHVVGYQPVKYYQFLRK